MDFTEPTYKIDARYPYVFTVRGLASHHHLCWQPVSSEKAAEVIPILAALFEQHGRPLVMKSDNGSAFIAELTRSFFSAAEVAVLYSPPRQPKYNGALERSNTTMKSWTAASARAAGHPLHWTAADMQRAREIANQLSRPWGHGGQSPSDAWEQRSEITKEQRQQLISELAVQRVTAREQLGFDKLDDEELSCADWRQIDRVALSPLLQRLGYLKLTPVRRPPDKPKRPQLKLPDASDDREANLAPDNSDNSQLDCTANETRISADEAGPQQESLVTKETLAPSGTDDRMHQQESDTLQAAAPQDTPPKQCARAIYRWLRRPITLFFSIGKAAKIK